MSARGPSRRELVPSQRRSQCVARLDRAQFEDTKRMTGVTRGVGTLYGAISRLEESGLIQPLRPSERGNRTAIPQPETASCTTGLSHRFLRRRRVAQAGWKHYELRDDPEVALAIPTELAIATKKKLSHSWSGNPRRAARVLTLH